MLKDSDISAKMVFLKRDFAVVNFGRGFGVPWQQRKSTYDEQNWNRTYG